MNRERVLEIADDIEANGPERPEFHMEDFFLCDIDWKPGAPWCGAAGCIAGYVSALKVDNFSIDAHHEERARVWLGITDHQANALFYAKGRNCTLPDITAEIAVKCLHRFAETGKIDWARVT